MYLPGTLKAIDTFLEELIVRRELADNFCFYQRHYDSLKGAWEWARKTLNDHASDQREHIYTYVEPHACIFEWTVLRMTVGFNGFNVLKWILNLQERAIGEGKDCWSCKYTLCRITSYQTKCTVGRHWNFNLISWIVVINMPDLTVFFCINLTVLYWDFSCGMLLS